LTNPVINNIKMGYTTTATAAGTTTLTVASNYRQFFTGTSTQTIVLPVTSTLVTGIAYEIENNSTGTLTVNSSGGNLVGTIPSGVCAHAVCIGTTLTTAADWDWDYISTTTITGTGANVLGTAPTIASLNLTTALTLTGAAGTSGQYLTSAGTGAAPTWSTVASSQWTTTGSDIYYNTGNVGIGTSSPAANPKVTIKQASNTTDGGLLITSADASGSAGIARLNDGGMTFRNAGAETMRIVSTGELVVGGTTAGGVGTSIAAPDSGGIYCNTATTGARNHIRFVNPNGTVGSIQSSGSATSYNTSSDYRLKENIVPMTGALAKVAQLKPVTYKWKADGSDGEGFIAHELQTIKPDCVSGNKDAVEIYTDEDGNEATRPAYQGIDTSFLVATLTAALQETKALIDTQAETITALTARITALENA